MSTVAAHDITQTHDCKTAGCTNPSRSAVGRYSYCDSCRESRERQADVAPPKPAAAEGSFEQRAKVASKKLIAAGKRVDRSKANATTAAKAYKDAQAEWSAALRELAGEA